MFEIEDEATADPIGWQVDILFRNPPDPDQLAIGRRSDCGCGQSGADHGRTGVAGRVGAGDRAAPAASHRRPVRGPRLPRPCPGPGRGCAHRDRCGSPSARASTPPPGPASSRSTASPGSGGSLRVLDVGCGSGVLAIAAANRWPAAVLAVDNDPIAVRVARSNAELNGVGRRVRTELADGYAHPIIRRRRPYDLILANIPADRWSSLRALRAHLAPAAGPSCPGCWTARPRRWLRRIGARACSCSAMLSRALDGAGAGPICSGSPARLKPVPRRRCCAGRSLWL